MIFSSAFDSSLRWLCDQERELTRWREDLISHSDPDWAFIDSLDRHRDWLADQINDLNGRSKRDSN